MIRRPPRSTRTDTLFPYTTLFRSAERVNAAVTEFRSVIDLVARLGTHVTNFAAVMEQVQQVSQSIEQIAKTTNMLALNAAIEAARAGDAGRAEERRVGKECGSTCRAWWWQ